MRTLMLALGATAMVVPATMAVPTDQAQAQKHKRYKYKEFRGKDGRLHCRKPDGTTGLVVGAVGGALVGRTIDSKGDRTLGTVAGGVAGALLGREVDRSISKDKRCK